MKTTVLFSISLLSIPLSAHSRSTNLCFSPNEVGAMYDKRDTVSKTAVACLEKYWSTHEQFFNANGYSKYFGNRNEAIDTEVERQKVLLFKLWPEFISGFRPEEVQQLKAAKDILEVDSLVKKLNPGFVVKYEAKKKELNLKDRVRDELDVLMDAGKPLILSPNTGPNLQNISCVDMTRRCLSEGFRAAGLEPTWKKIDGLVKREGVSGVVLQKALSDLGWKVLYFNPDTSQNIAWDAEDKIIAPLKPKTPGGPMPKWNPIWGNHEASWNLYCLPDGKIRPGKTRGGVRCSDAYEVGAEAPVPVDDKSLLVNFGTRVPSAFTKIPFFVGTAHGGYHVFPGFFGKVIEAHSMRALTSKENLEISKFNPIDQANGGGPRWTSFEHYRTGVIAVPPGYIGGGRPSFDTDDDGCVDLKPRR